MIKSIFGIFKLALLLVIVALVFHNWTVKHALQLALKQQLGVSVEIDRARIDFMKGEVEFKGILIENPIGFGDQPYLAKIPLILVDFQWPSIFEGRLHFDAIGLSVEQLNLVRTDDGKLNLLALNVFQPGPTQDRREEKRRSEYKTPFVKIDELILSAGHVSYLDLSVPGRQNPRVFKLGLREKTYQDIHSIGDIVEIISWEALKRAGLSRMLDSAIGAQFGGIVDKVFSAIREF